MEVDMLVEVRAVAGLGALHVDLLDEAAAGEVLKAVIDRGQRDVRRAVLDPAEDIISGRVIRGLGEDLEDFAAVRREPHISAHDGQTATETAGLGCVLGL